jgi:hypothetical protein
MATYYLPTWWMIGNILLAYLPGLPASTKAANIDGLPTLEGEPARGNISSCKSRRFFVEYKLLRADQMVEYQPSQGRIVAVDYQPLQGGLSLVDYQPPRADQMVEC